MHSSSPAPLQQQMITSNSSLMLPNPNTGMLTSESAHGIHQDELPCLFNWQLWQFISGLAFHTLPYEQQNMN
jgi:hypothetical protein